jgi:hypothetical protein
MFSNLGTLQTEIIFIADFATSFCLNCGFCRPCSSGLYTMQHPQAKAFLKYQGALGLQPQGPVLSGTPQPSGVTQHQKTQFLMRNDLQT